MKTLLSILSLLVSLTAVSAWQSPSPRLRVMTYNIHHGEGTDGKLDLERVASVIKSANPDLVALQEVDRQTGRTQKVDQTAELGRLTGMHAAFGKTIDHEGGDYGAAILSRWPFEQTLPRVLPGSPGHETRPALTVRVRPPNWNGELSFVTVHLDHLKESERLAQVQRLLEHLAEEGAGPVIVAGDLNAIPDSAVLARFGDDWTNATAGQQRFTMPSRNPTRQIDYILARPAQEWRVVETQVIESEASDHCALVGTLEFVSLGQPGASLPRAAIDGTGPGWQALQLEHFTNVNCQADTWTWTSGLIRCTGNPVGVIRTLKPYTNFELVVQWRHLTEGGNSGVFVWATPESIRKLEQGEGCLPTGIEVQILDHGYTAQYEKLTGKKADWFTTNGDVFPTGTTEMVPFPPSAPGGKRSFPSKNLSKGVGEWNHYYVRCINGEVRLWVNGEEVSGGTQIRPATGYLCLESEGAPIEFKDLRVRELP